MAEGPEPRVMETPGRRVEPEMTYWDWGFGVMVEEPMVRGGGVVRGRREVLVP